MRLGQTYARVLMGLEIKLGKELYGKSRKTSRHNGEKMQTMDRRCLWGGRIFGVGCRENELERSRVVVRRCTGLHWVGLAGV